MGARMTPVVRGNGCWHWPGFVNEQGYPAPRVRQRAYVEAYGPMPAGTEIEHRCHTEDPTCEGGPTCLHRRCVNPAHLMAVTHLENMLASGRIREQVERQHCPHGHPYSGDNLKLVQRPNGRVWRQCRTCLRASWRKSTPKYRARRQAVAS